MSNRNTKRIIGLFGILVSIASIVYLSMKVDFRAALASMETMRWEFVPILSAIYLIGFIPRALRWKWMLSPFSQVSFKDLLNSIVIGYAGNNIIPARGGELLRMEYFSRRTNINRVTALSSVLTEKILDGVCLIIIMLAAIMMAKTDLTQTPWFRDMIWLVITGFSTALLALVCIRLFGSSLITWLEKRNTSWSKLPISLIGKVHESLYFIKLDLNSLKILLSGVLIWVIEGTMFALGLYAMGIEVDPWIAGYICLTVVSFGVLIPSSPGYVGLYQGMAILALSLFGVPEAEALSYSLIVHMTQLIPITLWGVFLLGSFSVAKIAQSSSS